ncbi:MAG: SRPBCC family protein [Bacteroidia bacterium]
MRNKITISANINSNLEKVWNCYTLPEHITKWNFADPSWHCPSAENDMKVGGIYNARMEAKDGSFGFDFKAVYSEIIPHKEFTYGFDDRTVNVKFTGKENQTEVTIQFDPENENPIDMQQAGWQMILNNFKTYVESLNN